MMAETQIEKATDVEMVALSAEQSEPLMSKSGHTLIVTNPQKDDGDNDDDDDDGITAAKSHGTEVLKQMESPTSQDVGLPSSPTHEFLMSGTIPKNRKRPGSTSDSQRVTMTGTVTRGNSVGQPVEVELELTETEFVRLTSREQHSKSDEKCGCSRTQGPHIVLLSFLAIPFAMIISLCFTFYNACMTWYNLIIYFSEEKSIVHKLTICPILILSFPLTVGLTSVIIALVASVMQLSWSWTRWLAEIMDGEKGFCGWLCSKLNLPNCSPYQVVVLDDTAM